MSDREGDTTGERRKNDEKFKADMLHRLERIDRTLFDEDGNSNIRILSRQQVKLHQENTGRLEKLERAMFDDQGQSRMKRVEEGQKQIMDVLGKGRFLTAVLLGAVTLFGPIGTFIVSLVSAIKGR